VILRRVLFFMAGASAMATSAGVVVVALAFALFAAVRPLIGPAWAAAAVAGAAALMILVIGLSLASLGRPQRRSLPQGEGLVERAIELLKEKPLTAAAGAVAAGILAVRNPAYLGALARAFVEGREPRRRRGR
jgi:hypothetical protein